MDEILYFEFKQKGKIIKFQIIENGLICSNCEKRYKNIILHLKTKAQCKGNIDMEEFKKQFLAYRRPTILQNKKER